jgi:hypothetical protein
MFGTLSFVMSTEKIQSVIVTGRSVGIVPLLTKSRGERGRESNNYRPNGFRLEEEWRNKFTWVFCRGILQYLLYFLYFLTYCLV